MKTTEYQDWSDLNPVDLTILAYERIAQPYTRLWFDDPVMEPEIDNFLEYIELPGEILDVGCGPGRDVKAFTSKGVNAVGVDLSPAMLAEARSCVPDSLFRLMDMRNLKYPPDSFAGVWACASLHHLPEKDAVQAMNEFARVLKPGGMLSITVEEGLGEGFDNIGRYRKYYSDAELRKLAISSGFEILLERRSQSVKGTLESNRTKNWLQVFAKKTTEEFQDSLSQYDCPFCWESRFQLCRKIGIPATESILWGNNELYVFPAVAPLAEGHLLIASVFHKICFGACSENVEASLLNTQRRIRKLLKEVYKQPILFFEHGPARPKLAGACIDHAHMHCLPLDLSLKREVEQRLGSGQRASFNSLRDIYQSGQSYLYLEDEVDEGWVYSVEVMPSQFLRQIIARILGQSDWRWQDNCGTSGSAHVYRNTLDRLLPLVDHLFK